MLCDRFLIFRKPQPVGRNRNGKCELECGIYHNIYVTLDMLFKTAEYLFSGVKLEF